MKRIIFLKNFIAFAIISILLFNSSGYLILFISSTHFIKKIVYEKLLNDELKDEIILLSVSKKDLAENKISFQWIDSREFRLNGKMYDIKRNLSDADSLRFLCYYDDDENLLEELFHSFSKSETERNKDRSNQISLWTFLGLFIQKPAQLLVDFSSHKIQIYHFNQSNQFFAEVITPPPQQYWIIISYFWKKLDKPWQSVYLRIHFMNSEIVQYVHSKFFGSSLWLFNI